MRRITLFLLFAVLIGCVQKRTTPSPPAMVDVSSQSPHESDWRHWSVWVLAGSSIDPPGMEGLANLTAQCVAQLGREMPSSTDRIWTTTVGQDWTEHTLRCPTDQASDCQRHFLDAIGQPTFTATTLAGVRDQSAHERSATADANTLLQELAFEGHRYAHHRSGRAASVQMLTLPHVQDFHARQYTQETSLFATDHDASSFALAVSQTFPPRGAISPHEPSHFLPVRHTHTPIVVVDTDGEPPALWAARVVPGAAPEALLPERWHLERRTVPFASDAPLIEQLNSWQRKATSRDTASAPIAAAPSRTPSGLREQLWKQYESRPHTPILHRANDDPWPWVFLLTGDSDATGPLTERLRNDVVDSDAPYTVHHGFYPEDE